MNKLKEVEKVELKELILKEIENVPEPYLVQILDFTRFLETRLRLSGEACYTYST